MAGWLDTTVPPENVAVYAVNGSLRHILNSISHIGKAEHLRPGPAFPVTTSLNTHTCRDGQPAQNRSFKFSGIAAVFKKRSFRAMCKLHPQKRRHSPSSCILNASGNFRLDQPRSVVPFPMSVHTVAEPAFHAVISHSPSKIGFHRPQGTLSGAEYPPPINASHQGILGNPPIKIPAPAETVHLSERYPPYPALSSKIGIHANGISAPVIVITIYAAPGTLAGEIPQPHSPYIACIPLIQPHRG